LSDIRLSGTPTSHNCSVWAKSLQTFDDFHLTQL
jgi:hypothetical protein